MKWRWSCVNIYVLPICLNIMKPQVIHQNITLCTLYPIWPLVCFLCMIFLDSFNSVSVIYMLSKTAKIKQCTKQLERNSSHYKCCIHLSKYSHLKIFYFFLFWSTKLWHWFTFLVVTFLKSHFVFMNYFGSSKHFKKAHRK